MWYSAKVAYKKVNDAGVYGSHKELYLVDALSFTEAEARVTGEFVGVDDFKVMALKIEDYASVLEAIEDNGDSAWYKVRLNFINEEGKVSGTDNILVLSSSTDDALRRTKDHMRGSLACFEIHSVSKTKIESVIFYDKEKETEETK